MTRDDGSVQRRLLPATVWLRGERRVRVRVARAPKIVRIEIDPTSAFPDLDHDNQVWVP